MQFRCVNGYNMKNTNKTSKSIQLSSVLGLAAAASLSGLSCAQGVSGLPYSEDLKLDVVAHLNLATGASSVSEETLATHGHDPNQNFTVQGFELSLNGRYKDNLQFFVNVNTFLSLEDNFDSELEEAFVKLVDLPFGLQARAGRYFNRLSVDNNVHLHSWDFVNSDLNITQFLGEEGLITEGIEFTKQLGNFIFDAAYGAVLEHDEEEEGGEEEHGGENANFSGNDGVFTLRSTWDYAYDDFHQYRWILNLGSGENSFGDNRDSLFLGSDLVYTYRANGYEPGSDRLTIAGSWFYRQVEYAHEDGAGNGRSGHYGLGIEASYSFANKWTTSARYDYIDGTQEGFDAGENAFALQIEERERYSLALTRHLYSTPTENSYLRLQTDIDELASGDQEHSIWLQFGWNFGGPEIR